jgi:hypothetical protein
MQSRLAPTGTKHQMIDGKKPLGPEGGIGPAESKIDSPSYAIFVPRASLLRMCDERGAKLVGSAVPATG